MPDIGKLAELAETKLTPERSKFAEIDDILPFLNAKLIEKSPTSGFAKSVRAELSRSHSSSRGSGSRRSCAGVE